MTENATTNPMAVWATLAYTDAHAAARFLVQAFGFERRALYTRDDDPDIVEHAELRWSPAGGVMFGSAGKDDGEFAQRAPGSGAMYLVCSDPDALFARATEAGAEVVQPLQDKDYGSRDFVVRDPEGNLWCFGTYPGQ